VLQVAGKARETDSEFALMDDMEAKIVQGTTKHKKKNVQTNQVRFYLKILG
jgi:hypothetical protein